MTSFDRTIIKVFKHEGGFVNNPSDPGGATKFGITHKTLASWRNEEVSFRDVVRMERKEAKEIYRSLYWDKMRLDEINDEKVAAAIMDMGVNSGCRQGVKILQRAVNSVGSYKLGSRFVGLKVDGLIGRNTLRETNRVNSTLLLPAFFLERSKFYVDICRRRRASRGFLYAWIRRSIDYV